MVHATPLTGTHWRALSEQAQWYIPHLLQSNKHNTWSLLCILTHRLSWYTEDAHRLSQMVHWRRLRVPCDHTPTTPPCCLTWSTLNTLVEFDNILTHCIALTCCLMGLAGGWLAGWHSQHRFLPHTCTFLRPDTFHFYADIFMYIKWTFLRTRHFFMLFIFWCGISCQWRKLLIKGHFCPQLK